MDKVKMLLEVAQRLLKVVADVRALADSVEAVCTVISEGFAEEKGAQSFLTRSQPRSLLKSQWKRSGGFLERRTEPGILKKSEKSFISMGLIV